MDKKQARQVEAIPRDGHHGTTATTTITQATAQRVSLYTFLRTDISSEGHRLLPPYLTTTDLLHLSECSKDLKGYRYTLQTIKLTPRFKYYDPARRVRDDEHAEALKIRVVRLLASQEAVMALCLQHGQITESGASAGVVLRAVNQGGLWGLKSLSVQMYSSSYYNNVLVVWWDSLSQVLSSGKLKQLERLEIHTEGHDLPSAVLDGFACAVTRGDYPVLRHICVSRIMGSSYGGLGLLGQALESGQCRGLQKLIMRAHPRILQALKGGCCPALRALTVEDNQDGLEALGDALQSGRCPMLEDLEVRLLIPPADGCLPVFEALRAGVCPHLKQVRVVGGCLFGPLCATSLAGALSTGCLISLERLELPGCFKESRELGRVLHAMTLGACPNLRFLNISSNDLNWADGVVLGVTIRRNALSKLETLDLTDNVGLGDGGLVPIMEGLAAGGCQELKELRLLSCGAGEDTAIALVRALPSLALTTMEYQGLGDQAMANIITVLASGQSRNTLVLLNVSKTDTGQHAGQALVQALKGGAWSRLSELSVGFGELSHESVWVELAKAFLGGAGSKLEKISVSSGIDESGTCRLCEATRSGACPMLRELKTPLRSLDAFSIRGWHIRVPVSRDYYYI